MPGDKRHDGTVGEAELPRFVAEQAAEAPQVDIVDDDDIVAGLERAGGYGVVALDAGTGGEADGLAVQPGLVDVVDGAKVEGGGLQGLGVGQGDGGSIPQGAIIGGKAGIGPFFPRYDGCRHRLPGGKFGRGDGPGLTRGA